MCAVVTGFQTCARPISLGEIVARDGLYRIQTPQAFRFDALWDAHGRWPVDEEATDDAQMVRRFGGGVALVEGETMLDKITYPADIAADEARAAVAMVSRSASGFDEIGRANV